MVKESVEVERKYLVVELPDGVRAENGAPIIQGYLVIDARAEVRVRRKSGRCTLTVKRGHGLSRAEHEIALDDSQFEALWPATAGRRVEKTRIEIPLGALTAELDLYHGALDGLSTVEVEFASVEKAGAFEAPAWFGRELTDDARYANRNLAVDGRPALD